MIFPRERRRNSSYFIFKLFFTFILFNPKFDLHARCYTNNKTHKTLDTIEGGNICLRKSRNIRASKIGDIRFYSLFSTAKATLQSSFEEVFFEAQINMNCQFCFLSANKFLNMIQQFQFDGYGASFSWYTYFELIVRNLIMFS